MSDGGMDFKSRDESTYRATIKEATSRIRTAFVDAQSRRPYVNLTIAPLLEAMLPDGGNWRVEVPEGAIVRQVEWNSREVALINPRGDFTDQIEGEIAMAVRALPRLDMAMRSILVLAEKAENLELIRRMCASLIWFVEQPAPEVPEPDGEPS